MRHRDAAHYILNQVRAAVDDVDDTTVAELSRLLRSAKSVVIFGRGRSGLVGRALAMRLTHLGFRAYVVGETITPPVHEDDVVVLISGTGETFSVRVTGEIAKGLGCKVVSVTGVKTSTLARMADLVVHLRTSGSARQRELAPLGTLFEDACQVFLDGFVAQLMDEMGESEESMRKRHATLE